MTTPAPRTKPGHVQYYEYLRIFSALCVILAHVSAQNLDSVFLNSTPYHIFNLADSSSRSCVALFTMISGALFLDPDKELSLSKLFKKSIFRMLMAFILWSGFYALVDYFQTRSLQATLLAFLDGHYHLWYLLRICGLYLSVPLLRLITPSKKMTEYLLITMLVFMSLLPGLCGYLDIVSTPAMQPYLDVLRGTLTDINYPFTHCYLFYFVLGHYLSKYDVPVILRKSCFMMWIFGILATALTTHLYSNKLLVFSSVYYHEFFPHLVVFVTGVFLAFKYYISRIPFPEPIVRVLTRLSGLSFGVYLIHPFVLESLNRWFGLNTLSFHPIISVPLLMVIVPAVSWLGSYILNRIPVLNKYLV